MLHRSASVEFAVWQPGLLNGCGYMKNKSNHGSANYFIAASRRDCSLLPFFFLQ